jgi:hypothetical protein
MVMTIPLILGGIHKLLMWSRSTGKPWFPCILKGEVFILLQSTPFINILLRRAMQHGFKKSKDVTKTYKEICWSLINFEIAIQVRIAH